MNVPIGADTKSIFHGVINFHLFNVVKPLIQECLQGILRLRLLSIIQKAVLVYKLCKLFKEIKALGTPTKENTIRHNTHVLIDMKKDFFAKENNNNRLPEFEAIANLIILIFDGDYYYWERIEYEITQFYNKIQAGDWELREELPRRTWWGHEEVCSTCAQVKSSPQVFANCPTGAHITTGVKSHLIAALDKVREHVDGSPESTEGLGHLDDLLMLID